MPRKPFDPRVDVLVAIDPAMLVSGWAVLTDYETFSGRLCGVENLRFIDRLAFLSRLPKSCRVFVLVEYPAWSGHGAEQVRAAANCWIRYIQDRAATGVQVITDKVAPQTWQTKLIGVSSGGRGRAKVDPKPLYMEFARGYASVSGEIVTDENQAAAICLRSYAYEDLKRVAPTLFLTDAERKAARKK